MNLDTYLTHIRIWLVMAMALLSFFCSSQFLLLDANLVVAICCISAFFLLHNVRRRRDPLLPWPVVGMLPGLLSQIHRLHDHTTDTLRLAGCTLLFKGPWLANMDVLVTCDPVNVNHIFNTNFHNYPKGDDYVEIFDILGDGIFNADHESWRSQRRMIHGLMTDPNFRRFVIESTRNKVRSALVPILAGAMERGSVIDLEDLFLRFTFDETSTLVMGVDPCCLSPGLPTVPFAKALDDAMEVLFLRHVVPRSWWIFLKRMGIGPERRISSARETMNEFIEKHVSAKKEQTSKFSEEHRRKTTNNNNNFPDMLTSCLKTKADSNGPDLFKSKAFLGDMVLNLMLAGRDTTASGLSWFFYLLSQNPQVESKILEELKSDSTRISNLINGDFDARDLNSLVYLHACLCESLRLYPPLPFEHKSVTQLDALPSGHVVSPRSKILISLYSMARMEGVWGKDCNEFIPERWIDGQTGKIRHEPSYKFMSFNSGPRTCLGKEIAFTQMKVVVASILSRFHVELVEDHVVIPKPSILLHMKNGLMVRIKERQSSDIHTERTIC